MHKLVTLASVVVLAASSANCAREGANPSDRTPSSILAPSALDGKPGGGGGSSSFTLRMVTDVNGNGLPNWGDQVTFNVATSATTTPRVDLTCSQNGVVVLGATAGFYEGYPWPWTQIMTLSSPSWPSGAADCKAVLYYFGGRKNVVLSTINFTASE